MPQFTIESKNMKNQNALITGEDFKHLVKVLRRKVGDKVRITDGTKRYQAEITDIGSKEAALRILEELPLRQPQNSPALGVALLKHNHLETVIQKGVELGCNTFYLFTTERTVPRHKEGVTPKKMERFQKIAAAAAKQCGVIREPVIHSPVSWKETVQTFSKFSSVFLAWEGSCTSDFRKIFTSAKKENCLLIIGPEGGWSEEEIRLAENGGAQRVGLGDIILRAETAAIVLLTLAQYELGNL